MVIMKKFDFQCSESIVTSLNFALQAFIGKWKSQENRVHRRYPAKLECLLGVHCPHNENEKRAEEIQKESTWFEWFGPKEYFVCESFNGSTKAYFLFLDQTLFSIFKLNWSVVWNLENGQIKTRTVNCQIFIWLRTKFLQRKLRLRLIFD